MHDFLHNVGQVIAALWQLGRRRNWVPRAWHRTTQAWDFYALWVSRLTRVALVAVIGQPIAIILVSLAGVHELTVFMALTPVLALLFLLVVASLPQHQDELAAALSIGVVANAWGRNDRNDENSQRTRTARILNAIFRGLALFLLLDAAFGLYFSLLPIENNRGLVLWIVLMGIIFLLAVALQPPSRRKVIVNWAVGILLVGSAIAVFVLFPVLLLNGGWRETKSDVAKAFNDDAKAAVGREPSGSFCVKISLAGQNNWVGPIGITTHVEGEIGFIPGGGWKYIVDGPADARERGSDGKIIGIYDPDPLPNGRADFDGPAGETITVKVRPPDGEYVC